MTNSKIRNINLDIIRCIAIFCVISVHFFLNTGFYSEIVLGKRMFIATILRNVFMICVPLFVLLTGFLMHRKELSKNYYKGIIKTILTYIICTTIIMIYRKVRYNDINSLFDALLIVLNYSYYAWYVEMYIGLYILIPFLNILFNSLSKENQKLFIITLLISTSLPSLTQTIGFNIFPDYWIGIWVFTYYYIGAYISKYMSDFNIIPLKMNLIFMILSYFVTGSICIACSYNKQFVSGFWCEYWGWLVVINSILTFLYFARIDFSNLPLLLKNIIIKISNVSFGMYLLSYIFDDFIYKILILKVINFHDRLYYFPLIVSIIFISTYVLSSIVFFIQNKILTKKI